MIETRLLVYFLAVARELNITKAAESLFLSQSTLSHHMRILCDAGLVSCERNGKWAHYVLSPDGAALARSYLDRLWA